MPMFSPRLRAIANDLRQHLARFKAVREKFDPQGIFKSVVGESLGLYD